jgi:hypothetical protein
MLRLVRGSLPSIRCGHNDTPTSDEAAEIAVSVAIRPMRILGSYYGAA